MAADYDFRRKPNEKGDEELQPLYPRIVSKGTIDCKRLFREISEASTFTEGDLAGIMVSLQEKVSYYPRRVSREIRRNRIFLRKLESTSGYG